MLLTLRRSAIAMVIVAALAVSGCTSQGTDAGSGGSGEDGVEGVSAEDTLTIGARVDNNSFDPAELEIGNRVQYWQPVYDTLLRLDAQGVPQPNLATDWEYNDDETVLTLQLRDDVTFTDGERFDAAAVKANIEHIQAGSGQNRFMVADIEEVVVNSSTEVELRLSGPVPALLSYLSWVAGVMASPAAIESGTLATQPVGSGPYVYDAEASIPATSYHYMRNEEYWNVKDFPYDAVEVRPLNDITAALNALKTGQIDAALLTPAVAEEAESSGITLYTLANQWAGLVLFDREGTSAPELADARVRRAINLAIDRESMVEFILSGYGEPSNQVFVDNEAFDEALDKTYPYDLDQARDLMEEAGVDELSLSLPRWDGPWNDLFPVLEEQLAEIGVTLEYEEIPPDQAVSEALSGDYPVTFFPLTSADAWQDIQTWVTPTAPWNALGAQDRELSRLIKKARAADKTDRPAAMQAVNAWLVQEAWFAPFFRQENIFGTVEGTTTSTQAHNTVPSLWSFKPK